VTTNPTLILKAGQDFRKTIITIAGLIEGPVLAEAVSEDRDGIVKEGLEMAKWAPNVVVKIPITRQGLEATRILDEEGVQTALTLVFSPTQALLAAKAGASFVSPFVGRLDDISHDGMALVSTIVRMYGNYDIPTEVIVASVRNPLHVVEAAMMGAHISTVPYTVFKQMLAHPLTDKGIAAFLDDWAQVKGR
jgi:transaldolase